MARVIGHGCEVAVEDPRTSRPAADPQEEAEVPMYLVERYWPGVTIERLREALDGARRVLADMRLEGILVRPLSCTLIPGEEVVFSVYEGPSADAVRVHNERAGIPFNRIVEAIAVAGEEKIPAGDGG
jgi:Protein of unknown function (DUF4242)